MFDYKRVIPSVTAGTDVPYLLCQSKRDEHRQQKMRKETKFLEKKRNSSPNPGGDSKMSQSNNTLDQRGSLITQKWADLGLAHVIEAFSW